MVVVALSKVITQGVVVHRLQQPLPSLLLQVTYNAHWSTELAPVDNVVSPGGHEVH